VVEYRKREWMYSNQDQERGYVIDLHIERRIEDI
jgi:hypothetical protein